MTMTDVGRQYFADCLLHVDSLTKLLCVFYKSINPQCSLCQCGLRLNVFKQIQVLNAHKRFLGNFQCRGLVCEFTDGFSHVDIFYAGFDTL